jgi:hypothetical protein
MEHLALDPNPASTPPQTDVELPADLVAALAGALDDRLAWDCIDALAYRRMSLRDFAKRRGIPRSTFSRNVAGHVVIRLKTRLGEYIDKARFPSDIGEIAEAVAKCFSREEFRALIPRPKKTPKKKETKSWKD